MTTKTITISATELERLYRWHTDKTPTARLIRLEQSQETGLGATLIAYSIENDGTQQNGKWTELTDYSEW